MWRGRFCTSLVEIYDAEKSKPKVIWKYKYDKEYCEWMSLFWLIIPIAGGFLLYSGNYIIGLFAVIFGVLLGLLVLCVETEGINFRKKLKMAKKYGKKYVGKIRAYELHGKENFFRVKGAEGREVKLKYVLEIELENSVRKIIHTPELRYNPTCVLKSNRCTVYQYENEYYAADFDLRRRRTHETAKIPRSKIISETR